MKNHLKLEKQLKEMKITNDRLCFTDSRDNKIGLDYTFIQIFDNDGILDFFKFLMIIIV